MKDMFEAVACFHIQLDDDGSIQKVEVDRRPSKTATSQATPEQSNRTV
jgi:hypothetical protein